MIFLRKWFKDNNKSKATKKNEEQGLSKYDQLIIDLVCITRALMLSIEESFIESGLHFKSNVKYESIILSLWIVTTSIYNKKIKDDLHHAYTKKMNESNKIIFYEDIARRYRHYNHGFEKFMESQGAGGPYFSAILYEIIVNGNHDFDKNWIPTVSDIESMSLFAIISAYVTSTKDMIDELANEDSDIKKYINEE